MPIFIPFIACGLLLSGVIAACADSSDQRTKRENEEAQFRAHMQALAVRIAELEAMYRALNQLLGEKNQQVVTLAAEIVRLRAQLAGFGKLAA